MKPIMKPHRLYPPQDAQALGRFYTDHVSGMTKAGLEGKGAIAEQLAWRDRRIAELEAGNQQLEVLVAHGHKVQTKLWRVCTEAAAMLAETNHGGLSFKRRESMRLALEAASVPIPAQCAACPHQQPKPYCACGAPSCEVCHP